MKPDGLQIYIYNRYKLLESYITTTEIVDYILPAIYSKFL